MWSIKEKIYVAQSRVAERIIDEGYPSASCASMSALCSIKQATTWSNPIKAAVWSAVCPLASFESTSGATLANTSPLNTRNAYPCYSSYVGAARRCSHAPSHTRGARASVCFCRLHLLWLHVATGLCISCICQFKLIGHMLKEMNGGKNGRRRSEGREREKDIKYIKWISHHDL